MFTPSELDKFKQFIDDAVSNEERIRALEESNAYLQRKLEIIKSLTEVDEDPAAEAVSTAGTIKVTYLDESGVRTTKYYNVADVSDVDEELSLAVDEIKKSDRKPKGKAVTYRIYAGDSDRQIGKTQEYSWEFTS